MLRDNFGRGDTTVFILLRALGWDLIRNFCVIQSLNSLVGLELGFEASVFGIRVGGPAVDAIETDSAILKS